MLIMKTQIYTSLTSDFEREWQSLWDTSKRHATAFNSPAWLVAAQSAFDHRDIRIIAIRSKKNALVGVAALVKQQAYGVSVYASPAARFADKPSILIDWGDAAAVSALAAAFTSLGTVYLQYCKSEIAQALQNAQPAITFQDDLTSQVHFNGTYTGTLTKDTLKKIVKRMEKAPERVTVRYSKKNHHAILPDVYAVEEDSTKKERGMAEFIDKRTRNFFESIAQKNADLMRIILIDIGKKPVAYSVDFLAHEVYQGSQKAFVKGYEYYQPGKYMALKLLEKNFQEGRRAFDFGRGYDSFKEQFTNTPIPVYSIIIGNRAGGTYLKTVSAARKKIYETVVINHGLYKTIKKVKRVLALS